MLGYMRHVKKFVTRKRSPCQQTPVVFLIEATVELNPVVYLLQRRSQKRAEASKT